MLYEGKNYDVDLIAEKNDDITVVVNGVELFRLFNDGVRAFSDEEVITQEGYKELGELAIRMYIKSKRHRDRYGEF